MIMFINKTLLCALVASFVVFNHVQARGIEEKFTLDQYRGQWYDMGRISSCDNDIYPCSMYKVVKLVGHRFFQSHVSIQNVSSCEYGIPVYSRYLPVDLIDSAIRVNGSAKLYAPTAFTVKSYNNGSELILTDLETESCASTTYRLWSRNQNVSAETKAEFEKLVGNKNATYYNWEQCPKVRSETDESFGVKQIEGLWYDIASIFHGCGKNDTCGTNNFVVNNRNQTFDLAQFSIINGLLRETNNSGYIAKSKIIVEIPTGIDGTKDKYTSIPVICNEGGELIVYFDNGLMLGLLSRNPTVPSETMEEFKKLSKYFDDAHYTIFSQKDCPNRKD